MKDELDLLPTDKLQRFLQIAIIVLGVCGQACPNSVIKLIFCIQVSFESFQQIATMILMGTVKNSQSSQNRFSMSLQYLKKEVKDEVDFLHADKHQSFPKNTLGIKVSYKFNIIIINGHDQAFSNYSK